MKISFDYSSKEGLVTYDLINQAKEALRCVIDRGIPERLVVDAEMLQEAKEGLSMKEFTKYCLAVDISKFFISMLEEPENAKDKAERILNVLNMGI